MQDSIFHKLSNILWVCVVTAVVLLASYVSLGRYLSNNLQAWQDEVLALLNSRVPFTISAQRIGGQWSSFTPEILLHELELALPDDSAQPLQLTGGRVGIDVLQSLASRSLQITSLQLDGLTVRGELTEEGRLVIPGLTGGGGEFGEWLQAFLLNIEYVTLENNRLRLGLPGGLTRDLALALHLARDGSQRSLRADLVSARGTSISLHGSGLGDPFRPEQFEGTLYIQAETGDIAAVADLFGSTPPVWAEGELSAEAWVAWDRGEAEVDMSLSLVDAALRPADQAWSVPLDALSVKGKLLERRNRWTVYASDLRASHQGIVVDIPRLQFDAWGDSLRLRTAELQLAPLNQLFASMPSVPENLRSVFDTLNLRGELSALQLAVGDLANPMAGWDVEGNFDDLQVDSWKGAPGVTSGTGYFELSDSGGYVVIDSQQFSMAFPTVFRDPLYYDDFYGTLNLDWDAQALLLHSEVITATAVEGEAQALFSLNIPFTSTEQGLEMGLMVGLADSHPVHRSKYIPYTLNTSLLDWLSSAIGDGNIEQAGFVWRGSLRPGASALRTVQLMLNLDHTSLAYHPDWPPVADLKGIVLIDDTNVSIWAERARFYDSVVQHLSAEAWMATGNAMQLAIDGRVDGSATDGLRAVNDSLLGSLTGGVFADWIAEGDLQTSLQLQLNLADKEAPPLVDVSVELENVDLAINPGRLPLEAVDGQLRYTSGAGFRAKDVQATLWGRALTAQIRQRPLRGDDAPFKLGESALEVELQGSVAASDLQQWLSVDALALADGVTAVQGMVSVIPGETALLVLNSSLEGVALDLPAPWKKEAADSMVLELALPLGTEKTVIGMALGEDLSLHLDITGGAFQSASLGLSAAPPELESGAILVQGQAEVVDVESWLVFSSQYLLPAEAAETGVPVQNSAATVPTVDSPTEFRLGINDVQIQRLLLLGREYEDVDLSMQQSLDGLTVRATTDWLGGEYQQPAQGQASLRLDYLDLKVGDDAEGQQPAAVEEITDAEPMTLPVIAVSVDELRLDGTPAGELTLQLESVDGDILARNIQGEVLGMRLTSQSPGSLSWLAGEGSRLLLPLQFDDIGDSLEQLGYARFLETEEGQVNVDIAWAGSPDQFALAAIDGSVRLDLGEGRFLQTPGGAGALKVVEIVNLAGIVERLSLSHMFASGLSFDTMDGELFFHTGTLEVASLSVRSSASSFAMSGVSDIATRQLDGELVATLPVANNLPWVAALTAGPAVAAGVFVVSKVFEKQVNRLSSGVYSIEGTWDEPEVNFDRIFDNEVRLDAAGGEAPVPAATPTPTPDLQDSGSAGDSTDLTEAPVEADPVPAETNQPAS